MKLNVGDSIPVQCLQLAILTGHPSDEIQAGHSFAWGKGMFQVEAVNGEEATIRRLASQEIRALDQTKVLNPSQFHELDTWQNAGPQIDEPGRSQQTGTFLDPTDPQRKGGDVEPKNQVFPRELKSPRPALREPPVVDDDVRDPSVKLSSIHDPENMYETLVKISIDLHNVGWSNQVIDEMSNDADMGVGYAEYEEVLKMIIGEATQILSSMEEARQVFLRQRGINPSET